MLLLAAAEAAAQTRVRGYPNYGLVSVSRPGVTPQDERVYRKLEDTVVSFTFNDQPFADAIEFLQTLGNVNIVLDRRKVTFDAEQELRFVKTDSTWSQAGPSAAPTVFPPRKTGPLRLRRSRL